MAFFHTMFGNWSQGISSLLSIFIVTGFLGIAQAPPASAGGDSSDDFVTRSGTQFVVDDETFRFVGFNLFDAAATDDYKCGWWDRYTDAELDQAMKYIRHHAGATVLRFWAYQTYTKGGTDYSGVDKVIRLAKKNDLRLMPVLEDGPGYCTTGTAGDAKWENGDTYYTEGYKQPWGNAALSFQDYAPKIAAHYKDEPAILGWTMINEADTSAKRADGKSVLVDFATDMGDRIKAADPNHLLTVGTQSNGAPGATGIDFPAVYSVPTIDFTEGHDWSVHGWGDPNNPLPGSPDNGRSLPDPYSAECLPQRGAPLACALAHSLQLNKPFVIGESGIPAATESEREERAQRFDARMNSAFQLGAAGYVVWQFNKTLDTEHFDVLRETHDPLFKVMKRYGKCFAHPPYDRGNCPPL